MSEHDTIGPFEEITVGIEPDLEVSFRPSLGTISKLSPKTSPNFSFVPTDGDFGVNRTYPGFAGLGDISLRVRPAAHQSISLPPVPYLQEYPIYTSLSTATANIDSVALEMPKGPWEIAAHDITAQLGLPSDAKMQLVRRYAQAWDTGGIIVSYALTNLDPFNAIEIGALSIPLVFQGRWDGLTLEQMARLSTFTDMHVGGHHGWVTVTRMSGRGPILLLLPEKGTKFEAWRSGREDAANAGPLWTAHIMLHSKSYRDLEWSDAEESWNPPTSRIIPPNRSYIFGIRMLTAPSITHRDATLLAAGKAVVHGVPGYVIATDMDAQLLVTLPKTISGISRTQVDPEGALAVGMASQARPSGPWVLPVKGLLYGRCRLEVLFNESSSLAVHYFVLPPLRAHVDKFGAFLASRAWLGPDQGIDPFGRTHSVMPWDRDLQQHVMQDPRAFVVGLSDEAGAAANVALAVKARQSPKPEEAARLDEYIQRTLWGVDQDIPFPVSLQDHASGGIRASLFWVPTPGTSEEPMPGYEYEQSSLSGWIWNRERAVESLGRAYNYPHQTAVYHSMYRLAADNDLVASSRPALWYLQQAALTIKGMWSVAKWYTQFGLMAGSVFRDVLRDLELEGLHEDAAMVRGIMYNRTAVGFTYNSSLPCPLPPGPCGCKQGGPGQFLYRCRPWTDNEFPFGSEFAWDSTGQEEIYVWGKYFGKDDVAATALDAILAFMPNVPNWAYNGAALGIGDFSNNAKLTPYGGWERVLQHYRAGLNAIPLLEEYRAAPEGNVHLLLTGLGAVAGQLPNIDLHGQPSMAFHGDPSLMRHDPYSGDYGIGFLGHSHNSGAYLLFQQLGVEWLCFLCNLKILDQNNFMAHTPNLNRPGPGNAVIRLTPRDSYHRRIYVQPLRLYLVAEAGVFDNLQVDFRRQVANVSFEPLFDSLSSHVRLRIETPASAQMIGTKSFQVIATSPVKGPCQDHDKPIRNSSTCLKDIQTLGGAHLPSQACHTEDKNVADERYQCGVPDHLANHDNPS
ncbi:g144 [Coccomyxa elongata]